MKKAIIITMAGILCLASVNGFCANYYVDNTGTGSTANGQSWSSAWKSLSSINWSSIAPGDTIFISGGTTSKIYRERLIVGKSGTAGNPIIITKGSEPSHSGQVIIDGEMRRESGVDVQSKSHIIVKNLSITGSIDGSSKGQVYIKSSSNITIEGCEIINESAHGGIHLNGYPGGSQGNTSCIIRNNTITIPKKNMNYQTDGIYSQMNTGNFYENNYIYIGNSNIDQHCDNIQCFKDTNIKISGNYYIQDNTKGANSQGIFTENCMDLLIFNNVGYGMYTTSSLLKYINTDGSAGGVHFFNNTIIGGKSALLFTDDPKGFVKNNIFITYGGYHATMFRNYIRLNNMNQVDNNIYYCSTTNGAVSYGGRIYTLAEFQSLGADLSSRFLDPLLGSLADQFRPVSTTKDLRFGTNLSSYFTTDRDGNSRPSSGPWDVGAYQAGAEGQTIPKIEGLRILNQ